MQNCIIQVDSMKTKGQQPLVAKPELLAFCDFRGGLAERSNAAGLQPDNGASPTVHGFESLTRRQNNNNTLAEALTYTRARTAQPKPYESDNLSIRLLVGDDKGNRLDVPQLPDRLPEGRKAPRWNAAMPLRSMRKDVQRP
jgi:hypothetical protein